MNNAVSVQARYRKIPDKEMKQYLNGKEFSEVEGYIFENGITVLKSVDDIPEEGKILHVSIAHANGLLSLILCQSILNHFYPDLRFEHVKYLDGSARNFWAKEW